MLLASPSQCIRLVIVTLILCAIPQSASGRLVKRKSHRVPCRVSKSGSIEQPPSSINEEYQPSITQRADYTPTVDTPPVDYPPVDTHTVDIQASNDASAATAVLANSNENRQKFVPGSATPSPAPEGGSSPSPIPPPVSSVPAVVPPGSAVPYYADMNAAVVASSKSGYVSSSYSSSSAAASVSSSASSTSSLTTTATNMQVCEISVYTYDSPAACNKIYNESGACGLSTYFADTLSNPLPRVAVPNAIFDTYGSSQYNTLCGKTVTIKAANGKTGKAMIADRNAGTSFDLCMDLWVEFGYDAGGGRFQAEYTFD